MTIMKSKFKYMFDADPSASLLGQSDAAHTETFNGASYALDTLQGYWTDGELADQTFAIIVNVTAIKTSAGNETYTLELEAGPSGFASSIKPNKLTINSTGQYVILVDADTLKKMKSTADTIRLVGTLGGTAPSLSAYAWIAGIQK